MWAELDAAGPPATPAPLMQREAVVAAPGPCVRLCFLGLPVCVAVASGIDVDDRSRQVLVDAVRGPVDEEVAAFLSLLDRSAPVRLVGRHAALRAAARGDVRCSVFLDATMDALVASRALADVLAGSLDPATLTSPEVIEFRRWLADETKRQLSGSSPTECPIGRGS